jgi:NAD(P)-dependent dehydrogenase (short-subunit alcohol dehydrogenase family)
MTDLSDKVALVTGSARGIGKAIAVRYAQLGADIAINYSGDESNASKTVAEIGEIGRDAIAVQADVTKPAEIERLFTETLGRFGKVKIATVTNAVSLTVAASQWPCYASFLATNARHTLICRSSAPSMRASEITAGQRVAHKVGHHRRVWLDLRKLSEPGCRRHRLQCLRFAVATDCRM